MPHHGADNAIAARTRTDGLTAASGFHRHGIRTGIRRHAGLSGTIGMAIDQPGLRAVAGA
jgi:hypothetical protein